MRVKIAHVSLQFSDTEIQKTRDVTKILSQEFDIVTGTEAGPGAYDTSDLLKKFALKFGYKLAITNRYDTWVAVKQTMIKPGSWDTGSRFALWRSSRISPPPPGRWGDKAIVWASFDNSVVGPISVGSIHSLTHHGAGERWKDLSDRIYARKMGSWGEHHAKGKKIAFINGDFNLVDSRNDVFFGQPFTTCWDELDKYPNTGHGNIDAIASWDNDVRVKCLSADVDSDSEFFLNTDHYLIHAVYEIKPMKRS